MYQMMTFNRFKTSYSRGGDTLPVSDLMFFFAD